MIPHSTHGHLRSLRRVTVLEALVVRGEGVDHDPLREVVMYFDDDGKFLGECDPHKTMLAGLKALST